MMKARGQLSLRERNLTTEIYNNSVSTKGEISLFVGNNIRRINKGR